MTQEAQLNAKIAELKKLTSAEKLDTKAIVAMSREIDGITREAEKAELDKKQKGFAALASHIAGVIDHVVKPIIADGGIEKLHGDQWQVRYSVTKTAEAEPVYACVVTSAIGKPKASGGGGGGGAQRGNCMGTGLSMGQLVAQYGTAEQKASFNASTDKNVRYGIAKACAKLHKS